MRVLRRRSCTGGLFSFPRDTHAQRHATHTPQRTVASHEQRHRSRRHTDSSGCRACGANQLGEGTCRRKWGRKWGLVELKHRPLFLLRFSAPLLPYVFLRTARVTGCFSRVAGFLSVILAPRSGVVQSRATMLSNRMDSLLHRPHASKPSAHPSLSTAVGYIHSGASTRRCCRARRRGSRRRRSG